MLHDFDVRTFCQNLRATKPPYKCPIADCEKIYKSYSGIQFHLYNFDHDSPNSLAQIPKSGSKPHRKRGFAPEKWHHRRIRNCHSPQPSFRSSGIDSLSYADSQKVVEVKVNGRLHHLNIYEPLEVVSQDGAGSIEQMEKRETVDQMSVKMAKGVENCKPEDIMGMLPHSTTQSLKLPEARFRVLDDYIKPSKKPDHMFSYYRFMEKSMDELDGGVEYDMDEEDDAWLSLVNDLRAKDNVDPVSPEDFEIVMDRCEKEAFFQSQNAGRDAVPSIDEDAVCSICMDGECQNSNVILFCDMCNLAVHQECYGVPYIPEGQWLCRRCLQSPSRAVECVLCPNRGGAFKQTNDGRWAHVVCALWVPEVGFSNTVFLEPIDSLDRIPPARKKLPCYICKQRGNGACIQCHKTNCYTAFHVTCAQQAGLFMKIEAIVEPGPNGVLSGVRKTALCDVHMSPSKECSPMIADSDTYADGVSPQEAKVKSRIKMRKARKLLAKKRNAMPVVSIPIIPQERLQSVASFVSIANKDHFLKKLQNYWTLKRQSRFGVPLLRRLQSNHMNRNKENMKVDKESSVQREQLKYWLRLRQDLEKARLLLELIRKREKIKREQLRIHQMCVERQLQPLSLILLDALDQLQAKDPDSIFAEPVSLDEVPDYSEYVQQPMDFSSMRDKLEKYCSVAEFTRDFELVMANCLSYNDSDTVYYKAAVQLRDEGEEIISSACVTAEAVGLSVKPDTSHVTAGSLSGSAGSDEAPTADVEGSLPLEDQLRVLLERLAAANSGMTGDVHHKPDALSSTTERTTLSPLAASPERDVPPPGRTPAGPSWRSQGRGRCRRQRGKGHRVTPGSRSGRSLKRLSDAKDQLSNMSDSSSVECLQSASKNTRRLPARGVNRRTSVLLNRKRRVCMSAPHQSTQIFPDDVDDVSTADCSKSSMVAHSLSESAEAASRGSVAGSDSPDLNHKFGEPVSPESFAAGRKRQADFVQLHAELCDSPVKRSSPNVDASFSTMPDASANPDIAQGESFTVYRTITVKSSSDSTSALSSGSESESSTACSSTQSPSEPGTEADMSRSSQEEEQHEMLDMPPTTSPLAGPATLLKSGDDSPVGASVTVPATEDDVKGPLEPLDLVWAKCRGYPWYPALVIDPAMPTDGYCQNGVPIPVPPADVLQLQRSDDGVSYLVLFFDTKRTWQWLPRHKLERLGVISAADTARLTENRKSNVRKSVQKAYEKAIVHRCTVNGEPNPFSGDSSSDE